MTGGLIASTARLRVRQLDEADAPFYLKLVNEPAWLSNIGDRKLHTLVAAAEYIRDKSSAHYALHGYGMYLIERRGDGAPVGLCGLVRRDSLPGPDLGFALLEEEWGMGYAHEAAEAVTAYAFDVLKLPRLLAITLPGNARSIALLEKLGFRADGRILIERGELLLYTLAPS
jgi:RimJ/RimL family protein N-acetyltransferase